MKTTIIGLFALLAAGSSQAAMQTLSDTELDAVQGQALITADYTTLNGLGFYKVGLQANLEINANIRKLQLGCGGINGPGCDIDIDNFSLSGNCTTNRPSCDAVMKNPFIEFAVKNPGNSSQREITGFRLSSDLLTGLMTAGTNDGTANGINTLSGYMQIAASSGSTKTASVPMYNPLSGRATVTIFGAGVFTSGYVTDGRPLTVAGATANFNTSPVTINGSGLTGVTMQASSTMPDIAAYGERASTLECIIEVVCITIPHMHISSTVRGIKANLTINEALGYIHNIPLNNPFSLSLQKQDVLWPGQAVAAKRGWWMSISGPINMGSLSTPANYRLDISSTYSQVASRASNFLRENPISIDAGDAVKGILQYDIYKDVGVIDLSGYSPVTATFTNLPLGTAQNVTPNCWGSSKFC